LLLDQGADTYIAMLAVLKIQALYVSLDPRFPDHRIDYLTAETGVRMLVLESSLAERLLAPECPDMQVVLIDAQALEISRCATTRLDDNEHGGPVGELASLTYPTGPAGSAGGVEITHAGICNFALTAAKLSGLSVQDRVYEDLSTAPEFSVVGIWVAWMVGATLFPKGAGPSLWGPELRRFLATNRVTALYCTPALLASLDEDLPELRFVLLSEQACPSDLLARWRRPGRRVVSVYGTTESHPPVTTMPVLAPAEYSY
jgi:non-ribosomal peptide synthetase component F